MGGQGQLIVKQFHAARLSWKTKIMSVHCHVYLHFSSAALVLSVFGLRFPAIKLLENQPNTSILMYIE